MCKLQNDVGQFETHMSDVFEYAFGGKEAEEIYSVKMSFSRNGKTSVFERFKNPEQEFVCNAAV